MNNSNSPTRDCRGVQFVDKPYFCVYLSKKGGRSPQRGRKGATGCRSSRNKVQCRTHCAKAAYRKDAACQSGIRQQDIAVAATKCSAGRTAPKRQAAAPLLTALPVGEGLGRGSKKSSIYDLKKLKKDFVYSLCRPISIRTAFVHFRRW